MREKKKSKRKYTASKDASGGSDRASAKKWKRSGRIEAYTMGEASGKKKWP